MSFHFTLENRNANAAIVRLFFTWMGCWVKINLMHGKKKVCNQFHMSFEGISCVSIDRGGWFDGGLEYNRDKDIVVAPQLFFYSFLLLFHPQGWN